MANRGLSIALRLALVPVLFSLAYVRADAEGWEKVDRASVPFTIESTSGEKLADGALKGKIVVIDFWATWCGPCVQELPELARFADGIKGRKDVTFLSFSVDEDKADVARFFEGRKEKFPVYMAASLADKMEVMIFPTKVIVDARKGAPGRIVLKKEGVVETAELEAKVAELLKKP